MPQLGEGTCAMLSSSLEAVIVLRCIFLDTVQNREQKQGKDVTHLPAQQLSRWPYQASCKATGTGQPTAQ